MTLEAESGFPSQAEFDAAFLRFEDANARENDYRFQAKYRDRNAGRDFRLKGSIHAYCGPNGSGKSQAIAHDALHYLEAGIPVLSTMRFVRAETGEDYPNYTPLVDWQQALDFKGGLLVLDEIIGVAGARSHASLAIEVQNLLVQLRKADNPVMWSAPSFMRADLIVRETTKMVTQCRSYFPQEVINPETGRARHWRSNRLMRWKTYDAQDFEEWNAAKAGRLKADQTSWFWAPDSRAQLSYKTFENVTKIGGVIDSGRCLACNGVRRPKQCKCGDQHSVSIPGNASDAR